MKKKKLTQKQIVFAKNIIELGEKEALKCVKIAGYKKNEEKWAFKLLHDKTILAYIKKNKTVKKIGRPPKYSTVEELQILIDSYFETEEVYTITGLALHLDFTSRLALINYEKKDEFVYAIKKAKLKIENEYEKRMILRGNGGDIFALKNFGWNDKQEIDINSNNTNINLEKEITDEMTAQEASQIYHDTIKRG